MADWLDKYIREQGRTPPKKGARIGTVQRKRYKSPYRAELERLDRLARYGLTPEQYDEMLAAQGGVCVICDRPPTVRRLAVDHSHGSGRVRALLCAPCNLAIGRSVDPSWYRRAADYLEAHNRLDDV